MGGLRLCKAGFGTGALCGGGSTGLGIRCRPSGQGGAPVDLDLPLLGFCFSTGLDDLFRASARAWASASTPCRFSSSSRSPWSASRSSWGWGSTY